MGGFSVSGNDRRLTPKIIYMPIGKSKTIAQGDALIRTTVAGATTGGKPVVRILTATDITTNAYIETAVTIGTIGVSLVDAVADSSGYAGTRVVPSGPAAASGVIYGLPTYPAGLAADADGFSMIPVALWGEGNRFRVKLKSGTASQALVGTKAGIDLTSGVFTIDTAATTKTHKIVAWDDQDLTASIVIVELLAVYDQYQLGLNSAA